MTRSLPSRWSRGALIAAVAAALSAHAAALTNPVPVLTGLNGPRGLAVGPGGRLIYGENNGAVSELIARGQNAGTAQALNAVPATSIAPAVATLGGQIFVLTAGERQAAARIRYIASPTEQSGRLPTLAPIRYPIRIRTT